MDALHHHHVVLLQPDLLALPAGAAVGEVIDGRPGLSPFHQVPQAGLDGVHLQGLYPLEIRAAVGEPGGGIGPLVEVVQGEDLGLSPLAAEVIPKQVGGGGFPAAAGPGDHHQSCLAVEPPHRPGDALQMVVIALLHLGDHPLRAMDGTVVDLLQMVGIAQVTSCEIAHTGSSPLLFFPAFPPVAGGTPAAASH